MIQIFDAILDLSKETHPKKSRPIPKCDIDLNSSTWFALISERTDSLFGKYSQKPHCCSG